MATPAGVHKSNVSPVSSPKLRATSKFESPEPETPQPAPEPESKPQSKLESKPESKPEPKSELKQPPPKSDLKAREPTPPLDEAVSTESEPDPKDIIDMEVLGQILELDEPDDHQFSMGMTWAYFAQAKETFKDMNVALDAKDLKALSDLGHFLKGSSAALGIVKVRLSCERIQHYGKLYDEEADTALLEEEALTKIRKIVMNVLEEYDEAEQWLKAYYQRIAPNETPPSD